MPKRRAKGDGAIFFDENRKTYVGQISLGYDTNGKRKRKTVYGKTKAEVKEKLKNVEFQVYTGTFLNKNEITIYQLSKQILDNKLTQNEVKESTYFRHIETLKMLESIYNTPLQAVNETLLLSVFHSKLNYSQSSINKIYTLLNGTFKEAVKRKIISENPMADIKKPKSRQVNIPVRALTKEEQRKLIKILETEDINYKAQMLLSLSAGLRMGEINALFVEDINKDFKRLTIHRTISRGEKGAPLLSETPKTKAGNRVLILVDSVYDLLSECIGDKKSGLIFTQNGKMISTSQVYAQFNRMLKKYDIIDQTITNGKIDLHSLRHTFGTRCAEAGMPPKVLQEIMGHTDISITMNTYFYATKDYIQENLLKVNSILEQDGLSIRQPTTAVTKQLG